MGTKVSQSAMSADLVFANSVCVTFFHFAVQFYNIGSRVLARKSRYAGNFIQYL